MLLAATRGGARAARKIALLTDTLGLELTLLCWPVGLRCGLVDKHSNLDKHSDSAEIDASVPRVPFIVGNTGINFENLQYCTGSSVVPAWVRGGVQVELREMLR